MRQDLTEVVLIVDESGSMFNMTKDTIGHINRFIDDQKKVQGSANFTLVFFDDRYRVILDGVDIQQARNITGEDYRPTGMTALLDAVGKTINSIGQRLALTEEKNRPSKVIFAILTDGQENASQEFEHSKIKEMIEHQQGKYNWKFIFLAENIDAKTTGMSYGIAANMTMQNLGGVKGYATAYNVASACVANFRATGVADLGSAGSNGEDN